MATSSEEVGCLSEFEDTACRLLNIINELTRGELSKEEDDVLAIKDVIAMIVKVFHHEHDSLAAMVAKAKEVTAWWKNVYCALVFVSKTASMVLLGIATLFAVEEGPQKLKYYWSIVCGIFMAWMEFLQNFCWKLARLKPEIVMQQEEMLQREDSRQQKVDFDKRLDKNEDFVREMKAKLQQGREEQKRRTMGTLLLQAEVDDEDRIVEDRGETRAAKAFYPAPTMRPTSGKAGVREEEIKRDRQEERLDDDDIDSLLVKQCTEFLHVLHAAKEIKTKAANKKLKGCVAGAEKLGQQGQHRQEQAEYTQGSDKQVDRIYREDDPNSLAELGQASVLRARWHHADESKKQFYDEIEDVVGDEDEDDSISTTDKAAKERLEMKALLRKKKEVPTTLTTTSSYFQGGYIDLKTLRWQRK